MDCRHAVRREAPVTFLLLFEWFHLSVVHFCDSADEEQWVLGSPFCVFSVCSQSSPLINVLTFSRVYIMRSSFLSVV